MNSETTVSAPRLFGVMGDFMFPEVLARVATCSKTAHTFITPILRLKLSDKGEMYQMMCRLFPGIDGLPEGRDVLYYDSLMRRYFSPRSVPLPLETNYWVGAVVHSQLHPADEPRITFQVMTAMESAEGRRRLIQSINEWRALLALRHGGIHTPQEMLLDTLEACTRTVFGVRNDMIGTLHGNP